MQRNNPLPSQIHLDSSTTLKLSLGGTMFHERSVMNRLNVWHKVKIIRGAYYDKDEVLQAILNAVEPADLMPVKYQISGEDSFFIARNCGAALDKLCRNNLIVQIPNREALALTLTLAYAALHDINVNVQSILLNALCRKYDPNKKALNLESFHKDTELSKTIYYPLSQLRVFTHVLKVAKKAIAPFDHLNLQYNELSNLNALENCNFTQLKSLDLRHNNFKSMEDLVPLRSLTVTKLWLDDNPLCEKYSDPIKYIESARGYCPHLIQLDGVYTGTPGMPVTHSSYFKDWSRHKLVKQFLSHFFTLYDQGDRTSLKGLYHRDAFYSMSFSVPGAIAAKTNLQQYTASRNILKITDFRKNNKFLFCGEDSILPELKKLPKTYHDQSSFLCDLMYDDGHCLTISVEGIFKNLNPKQHQVLSFNRTFILVAGKDNEYNIINDQYHVYGGPVGISIDSIETKFHFEFQPQCFSHNEKEELIRNLRDLTTMNKEWCKSFLEEANYNFKKALTNFMKDYGSDSVPADAF